MKNSTSKSTKKRSISLKKTEDLISDRGDKAVDEKTVETVVHEPLHVKLGHALCCIRETTFDYS